MWMFILKVLVVKPGEYYIDKIRLATYFWKAIPVILPFSVNGNVELVLLHCKVYFCEKRISCLFPKCNLLESQIE